MGFTVIQTQLNRGSAAQGGRGRGSGAVWGWQQRQEQMERRSHTSLTRWLSGLHGTAWQPSAVRCGAVQCSAVQLCVAASRLSTLPSCFSRWGWNEALPSLPPLHQHPLGTFISGLGHIIPPSLYPSLHTHTHTPAGVHCCRHGAGAAAPRLPLGSGRQYLKHGGEAVRGRAGGGVICPSPTVVEWISARYQEPSHSPTSYSLLPFLARPSRSLLPSFCCRHPHLYPHVLSYPKPRLNPPTPPCTLIPLLVSCSLCFNLATPHPLPLPIMNVTLRPHPRSYVKLLMGMDLTKHFYFSYTYNLAATLQQNCQRAAEQQQQAAAAAAADAVRGSGMGWVRGGGWWVAVGLASRGVAGAG